MKPPLEMTLGEIKHLANTSGECLTMEDRELLVNSLSGIEFLVTVIQKTISTYVPEKVHTCPQCSQPKKEKDSIQEFKL
jgi:hypothetical protein